MCHVVSCHVSYVMCHVVSCHGHVRSCHVVSCHIMCLLCCVCVVCMLCAHHVHVCASCVYHVKWCSKVTDHFVLPACAWVWGCGKQTVACRSAALCILVSTTGAGCFGGAEASGHQPALPCWQVLQELVPVPPALWRQGELVG